MKLYVLFSQSIITNPNLSKEKILSSKRAVARPHRRFNYPSLRNLMAGSSKTKTSEFLSDVSFDETITSSPYLKPIRMKFTRDGQQITWDIGVELDCAVTILYHTEKKALLFVRQFRPPVFVRRVSLLTENVGKPLNEINWSEYPISLGITTECCAGLLDKPGLSPQQIVQEEILEEVGYQVPLEKIKFLKTSLKSVGVTGAFEHLFYTEIDESMKVSEGGGDDTENIEKVYLDLNEAKAILKADVTLSPPGLLYGVQWFFENRKI